MATRITLTQRLRAIRRMVLMIIVLAWYLCGLLLKSALFGETEERGFRYRRKYTGVAMRILGVRLTMQGEVHNRPALYVSNHRSLLDPVIQLRFIDAYIVSKAEVSAYPLIGRGAKETGVVFVHRESKESRSASREAIKELLTSGKSVLIYPEGTTSNLETTLPFRSGAFEMAAEVHAPVIPVVIQYGNPGHHWQDGPMLPFFMRKFSAKHIDANLSIGTPVPEGNTNEMLAASREWIGEEIGRTHPPFPLSSKKREYRY